MLLSENVVRRIYFMNFFNAKTRRTITIVIVVVVVLAMVLPLVWSAFQ